MHRHASVFWTMIIISLVWRLESVHVKGELTFSTSWNICDAEDREETDYSSKQHSDWGRWRAHHLPLIENKYPPPPLLMLKVNEPLTLRGGTVQTATREDNLHTSFLLLTSLTSKPAATELRLVHWATISSLSSGWRATVGWTNLRLRPLTRPQSSVSDLKTSLKFRNNTAAQQPSKVEQPVCSV